jgi:hypothetical protein
MNVKAIKLVLFNIAHVLTEGSDANEDSDAF